MQKRRYTNADHLYQQLKGYFEEQAFDVGDRVPAERELALRMEANRTTLRVAIQRLVSEGVIERHVGRGSFFKLSPGALSRCYQHVNTECSPRELLELRMMFEPQIGRLATVSASAEALGELAALGTALPVSPSLNDVECADIRFHEQLASVCNNALLRHVYEVPTAARRRMLSLHACGHMSPSGYRSDTEWLEVQRPLTEALLARDAARVTEALTAKLRRIVAALSL